MAFSVNRFLPPGELPPWSSDPSRRPGESENQWREAFLSLSLSLSLVGENFFAGRELCCRGVLQPSIHALPPNQAQPFIQESLGPLPMSPPSNSKLLAVSSRSHGKADSRDFRLENMKSSASVKIRGYDQYAFCAFARQA